MRTKLDRLTMAWVVFGAPVGAVVSFAMMGMVPIHGAAQWWFLPALLVMAAVPLLAATAVGYWLDVGRGLLGWLNSPAKPTTGE